MLSPIRVMTQRWPRPASRVGRLTLWLAVFVLACILVQAVAGHGRIEDGASSLAVTGFMILTALAFILLVRGIRRRVLWKVRNRLIVTYVLMGLAPVVLFTTLTLIAGYIFAGQFSINSALQGLDEAESQVHSEASSLASGMNAAGVPDSKRPMGFDEYGNFREDQISAALVRDGTLHSVAISVHNHLAPASPFDGQPLPKWLTRDFHGGLAWHGKLYLCHLTTSTEANKSSEVLTTLEIDPGVLASVGHRLGRVLLFAGFPGEHRSEINNAEQEAQSAEQQADLAESQREMQQQLRESQLEQQRAQRDTQEQVRETQRESEQELHEAQRDAEQQLHEAQRDAEQHLREAQRDLEQRQKELEGTNQDRDASAEEREEARKALQEAQQVSVQAQQQAAAAQSVHAPEVTVPRVPVPPALPIVLAPIVAPPVVVPPVVVPPVVVPPVVRPAQPRGTVAGVPQAKAPSQAGPDEGDFTAVSGGAVPVAGNVLDQRVYFTAPFPVVAWEDGGKRQAMLAVISRPSALYARLFSTSVEMGSLLRNVLVGIAVGFGLLELLAFWMASRLSGTITRSVAELYRGTTEIDNGNLEYRVRPRQPDQLGALAGSFNRMAGSIQDLLVQQRESDRVLNELAIAQEVQQNLFPQSPVSVAGLEMHAVCIPARSVSGDYFDFIFGNNTLGKGMGACIALGDISGKGISAALLMATLHSAVRAFSLHGDEGMPSPAQQLELLNKHLFNSTQQNRYATLFLAFYDVASRRLTYSNGGHLPPFLISTDGSVRRLNVGGPVVGLLEDLRYEEATVELRPGDLLAAFTDGITEPENKNEEEFGEQRLLHLLEQEGTLTLPEAADTVLTAVRSWITGSEQPDDMTLLLARAR